MFSRLVVEICHSIKLQRSTLEFFGGETSTQEQAFCPWPAGPQGVCLMSHVPFQLAQAEIADSLAYDATYRGRPFRDSVWETDSYPMRVLGPVALSL